MKEYSLNQTLEHLLGPTPEMILTYNQWAATALDRFHPNSKAEIEFMINDKFQKSILNWDSNFSKSAMKEEIDMANHGGVAMAWFIMSVILDYVYVEQSEIGDGVDYMFMKEEPNDEELNFIHEFHYVEISGILKEFKTNTLANRINKKHNQINKGSKNTYPSSVIVTLFSEPRIVKETHK